LTGDELAVNMCLYVSVSANDNSQPLSDINREETMPTTTIRPANSVISYELLDVDTQGQEVNYQQQSSPQSTTPTQHDYYNTPESLYQQLNTDRQPAAVYDQLQRAAI